MAEVYRSARLAAAYISKVAAEASGSSLSAKKIHPVIRSTTELSAFALKGLCAQVFNQCLESLSGAIL